MHELLLTLLLLTIDRMRSVHRGLEDAVLRDGDAFTAMGTFSVGGGNIFPNCLSCAGTELCSFCAGVSRNVTRHPCSHVYSSFLVAQTAPASFRCRDCSPGGSFFCSSCSETTHDAGLMKLFDDIE